MTPAEAQAQAQSVQGAIDALERKLRHARSDLVYVQSYQFQRRRQFWIARYQKGIEALERQMDILKRIAEGGAP